MDSSCPSISSALAESQKQVIQTYSLNQTEIMPPIPIHVHSTSENQGEFDTICKLPELLETQEQNPEDRVDDNPPSHSSYSLSEAHAMAPSEIWPRKEQWLIHEPQGFELLHNEMGEFVYS